MDRRSSIALGWATVELDRASRDLRSLLAPGTRFRAVPDSRLLGARCLIGRAAANQPSIEGSARWLVLLEPSTEGRLAATLARRGEGWWVTWDPDDEDHAHDARTTSGSQPGPLGPERLILGGVSGGTHRLLVRPVTIDP
jgi:hypothetical protein